MYLTLLYLLFLTVILLLLIIFPKYISKYAPALYIAAMVAATYIIGYRVMDVPLPKDIFTKSLSSGSLAGELFGIIMFIGALNDRWKVTQRLKSIRAEISVIATILTLGHNISLGFFGKKHYFLKLFEGIGAYKHPERFYAALVSVVLICIMIPLAVTSLKSVRRRMKQDTWNKLHKLAYLFYALLFVHISLILVPKLPKSIYGYIVYLAIFGTYLIMKLIKHFCWQKRLKACRS